MTELVVQPAPTPHRGRWRALLAAGAWVGLVTASAAVLLIVADFERRPGGQQFGPFIIGLVIFAVTAGTVGWYLQLRRPGIVVGRLLAVGPLLLIGAFTAYAFASDRRLSVGAGDLLGGLAAAIAGVILIPGIVLTFGGVGLTFPDGRLPGPRWRNPVRVIAVVVSLGSMFALVSDTGSDGMPANPLAIPGLGTTLASVASTAQALGMLASLVLAVIAVIARFRRADIVERQQLKWFAAAIAINALVLPLSFFTEVGPADAIDVASAVAATLIPLAIGIAILRYRLYEIDVIVNRAVVYGVVTAILAGLMSAAVALTKDAFEGVLGPGSDPSLVVSTILVVAAFEPVKKAVQARVDRHLRPGTDPSLMIASFVDDIRSFPGTLDPIRTMRAFVGHVGLAYRATAVAGTWSVKGNGPAIGAGEVRLVFSGPAQKRARSGDVVSVAAETGETAIRLEMTGASDPDSARAALGDAVRRLLDELVTPKPATSMARRSAVEEGDGASGVPRAMELEPDVP